MALRVILVVWALASGALAFGSTGQVGIDCDRGGDLARALARVERSGDDLTIRISGTCVGNFAFSGAAIALRGDSSGTSALVAERPGPVLAIDGNGTAVIDALTISGGTIGILLDRGRFGSVIDSVVRDNGEGIIVREGSDAFIKNTVVESNDFGIGTGTRSSASVVDSIVRNNRTQGAGAFNHSDLALVDTQIYGNLRGLNASVVSSINVVRSSLANHGEIHLIVRDRSTLNLISGTTVGAPGDSTPFAASVQQHAELRASSAKAIHGDILTGDVAYVSLAATSMTGRLLLNDFSRAKLTNTVLVGTVVCEGGSDAICLGTMSAESSGCPARPPAAVLRLASPEGDGASGMRWLMRTTEYYDEERGRSVALVTGANIDSDRLAEILLEGAR